jgi:diacylglycerol kinase family enzyme
MDTDPARATAAPIIVLLNAAAGGGHDAARVSEALRRAGIAADVRQFKPAELTAAARNAIQTGARVLVAAGGDGTINTVASALVGSEAILGVLPVGTLNHFARDLGVPLELEEAARILAAGQVRHVDVGQVNGRIFLNNCSIGLYPSLVIRREQQRQRLGRGKWLAMLLAFLSVFRRYPLVHVGLDLGGRSERCVTPLVFVGNNRYQTELLNLGRRLALDAGQLSVYLVNAPSRLRLLRLVLRGLLGKLATEKDFQSINLASLTVESRKRRLRMAMDGEVLRLRPPLAFQIRPRALRVLGP